MKVKKIPDGVDNGAEYNEKVYNCTKPFTNTLLSDIAKGKLPKCYIAEGIR